VFQRVCEQLTLNQ